MIEGWCLCKSVKYESNSDEIYFNHCHCSMCRKAHGAAFGSFLHVKADKFKWTLGESDITSYKSSQENRRNFCSKCGSNVPVVIAEENHVIIPAGTLEGKSSIQPQVHIFTGSKASWYEINDELPQFKAFPPS